MENSKGHTMGDKSNKSVGGQGNSQIKLPSSKTAVIKKMGTEPGTKYGQDPGKRGSK